MADDRAHEISEWLEGSCMSESDAAAAFDTDEDEVLQAITDVDLIERCTVCSWWCEKADMEIHVDEYVCSDCHEQSLDEESE